jgi:hypothetical protein
MPVVLDPNAEPIGDGRQPVNVFIGFLLSGFTDHVATLIGHFRGDERTQKHRDRARCVYYCADAPDDIFYISPAET